MPIVLEAERELLDDLAELRVGDVDPLVAGPCSACAGSAACFLTASDSRSASVFEPVAAALGVAAV